MRKFVVTIALALLSFSTFSQIVSLNTNEIKKLKTQIKNDGETKNYTWALKNRHSLI